MTHATTLVRRTHEAPHVLATRDRPDLRIRVDENQVLDVGVGRDVVHRFLDRREVLDEHGFCQAAFDHPAQVGGRLSRCCQLLVAMGRVLEICEDDQNQREGSQHSQH